MSAFNRKLRKILNTPLTPGRKASEIERLVEQRDAERAATPVVSDVRERLALGRVWGAMGCAPNPDDFKASERDAMWDLIVADCEAHAANDTRVYRENQSLLAELLELKARAAAPAEVETVVDDEPCTAETHSWSHYQPEQIDSYWIRCTELGAHEAHRDSNTGLSWGGPSRTNRRSFTGERYIDLERPDGTRKSNYEIQIEAARVRGDLPEGGVVGGA